MATSESKPGHAFPPELLRLPGTTQQVIDRREPRGPLRGPRVTLAVPPGGTG
jgi:hypothetical protein